MQFASLPASVPGWVSAANGPLFHEGLPLGKAPCRFLLVQGVGAYDFIGEA